MKSHTINLLSLLTIFLFLEMLISCGDNTKPTPSGSGKKIKIQSFAASKTEVGFGESFKLSWEVTNAELVSIDNGIGDNLVLTGEHEVSSIDHTTVYTLTAKSKNDEITQKLTVALKVSDNISAPVIVAFESSSTELTCGDSTTLSWETKNATKITITPNDGCDTSKKDHGNCEVFPNRKTTYKITAEN